jgi:hypothetical protein
MDVAIAARFIDWIRMPSARRVLRHNALKCEVWKDDRLIAHMDAQSLVADLASYRRLRELSTCMLL